MKSRARTSKPLSATMREISYQCVDPECGHTFVAQLEVVRTISPSAKPNKDIRLPISPRTVALLKEQLELMLPA
jgi:hypothetical protein